MKIKLLKDVSVKVENDIEILKKGSVQDFDDARAKAYIDAKIATLSKPKKPKRVTDD